MENVDQTSDQTCAAKDSYDRPDLRHRNEQNNLKNDTVQYDTGGDDSDTFKIEWRIVAQTIDRCLFLLYFVLFFLGEMLCFMI